jgi:hypothetical protein
MLWLNLILTLATAYFVKQSFGEDREGWLVFWSIMLGWNIHTLLGTM